MGGCKCTFRNCSNNSANSPGMHFFHYPLKDRARLLKWVEYANTKEILYLPFSKARNKVVCETHFKDDYFMNYKKGRLVHYAVPTIVRLSNDRCLDYEESNKPVPKPLSPPSQSHLIPPSSEKKQSLVEDDEKEYIVGIEPYDPVNSTTDTDSNIIIINEVPSTSRSRHNVQPKILNSCFQSQTRKKDKVDIIYASETSTIDILEQSTNEVNLVLEDHVIYNNEQESVNLTDTIENNQQDTIDEDLVPEEIQIEEYIEIENENLNRQMKKYSSKSLKRPLEDDLLINHRKNDQNIQSEKILTSKKSQNGKIKKIKLEGQASKAVSQNDSSNLKSNDEDNEKIENNPIENTIDVEINERNNLIEILEKDQRIKELEDELAKERNKNKKKENTPQAQVETISTSRQSHSNLNIPSQLTKVQLFNGIKKYLSPSMATIVRMEMFGGPDREWKDDEKQVSVELLCLGEYVFKYLRDEWRFRLPPLKSVQKWLEECENDGDEEDL